MNDRQFEIASICLSLVWVSTAVHFHQWASFAAFCVWFIMVHILKPLGK